MDPLEKKLDTLIDKLDKLYSTGGRSNIPQPAGSTSLGKNAEDFFSTLGKGVGNVFDTAQGFMGKAQANTATAQDVAGAITKTINQLTSDIPGISKFGQVFEGLTGVLTESVGNWQSLSGLGLQFGGDAIALNTAIKSTGMSVEQFAGQWEKLGPAIYNLGLGVTAGTKAYGELSARMLEPQYADQFNRLGMNVKDTNAALQMVMRGAGGFIDITKKENEAALLQSTIQLSREMDAMAKMTGKAREEQMKQVEQLQADAKTNARILINRRENPEANEDIRKAQQIAGSQLDPDVAKLFNEGMAGKGIFSTDAITQFGEIYGTPAANRMTQMARDINSTDKATREAALENLKMFNVQLMRAREGFGANIFAGGGADDNKFGQSAFGGINNQNEILRMAVEAVKSENGKKGYTDQQAYTEAMARINVLEQNSKKLEIKDGKLVEVDIVGAQLTSAVTGAETNIKRFGVGLNELIQNMTEQLGKLKGKDGSTYAANLEAKANMAISPTKSSTTEMMNSMNKVIEKMTEVPEAYGDKIATKILDGLKALLPSREDGTLGATGKYIENFGSGTLTMLHHNEGVIREDQADAFAMSRMGGIMPNLSKVMQRATATVSDSSSGADQVAEAISKLTTSSMPDFSNLGSGIDKLNSTFESLGPVLQQIARNTGDAATNTKDIGNYIS